MSATDSLLTSLQLLAARGAIGIATRGGLAAHATAIGGAGVAAGRTVFDTVTGQTVEVVGSTIAYLPADLLEGVKNV